APQFVRSQYELLLRLIFSCAEESAGNLSGRLLLSKC
ncbi:MAG: hypothetical protein ACI9OF_001938, partial [Saprospiraceae bacterium]